MAGRPDHHARTVGIWIIAIVAAAFGLYFGRDFFLPIAFAILMTVLFRPVVRWLHRLRMPVPAAAAVVVLGIIFVMLALAWSLSGPAQAWVQEAPARLGAAEEKLGRFKRPMQQVNEVAKKIEQVAEPTTGPSKAAAPPPSPPTGLAGRFLGTTSKIVGGIVEVLVLMYLLLATGSLFPQKLIKVIRAFRDKKMALEVVDETESVVARYMAVTALINLCQGALVGVVLWWLGMPNPLLWGCATFVLEFVPYLGAAAMVLALSVVAFASFDNFWHIAAAPGSYLFITTLQNNIVSPYAYGNKLNLNPVAVLIGVLLWWFLWGTGGAFLAVPIIAAFKIISDRVEGLQAIGEFLGE